MREVDLSFAEMLRNILDALLNVVAAFTLLLLLSTIAIGII
jgi:hypothetical protein